MLVGSTAQKHSCAADRWSSEPILHILGLFGHTMVLGWLSEVCLLYTRHLCHQCYWKFVWNYNEHQYNTEDGFLRVWCWSQKTQCHLDSEQSHIEWWASARWRHCCAWELLDAMWFAATHWVLYSQWIYAYRGVSACYEELHFTCQRIVQSYALWLNQKVYFILWH